MFNFGNITISDAEDAVNELISLQDSIIESVNAETRRLDTGRKRATRALKQAIGNIVITGDNERYALLSSVAQQAGAEVDFSAMVNAWTQQDEANRAERAALEEEWGTRQAVGNRVIALGEELELTKSANNEVDEEIQAWDETTSAIDAHNTKYPKAQITEENHDEYEEFKWGRWLDRYTLGLIFNSHAGPHEAYKIVAPYNKEYGDYYEDKLNIYKLRETHKDILAKQEAEQQKYNEVCDIADRMDALDAAYKGPERIASLIEAHIFDLVSDSVTFGAELVENVTGSEDALDAVNAAARLRGYEVIAPKLQKLSREAAETKSELQEPSRVLSEGDDMIPYERISFDFSDIEYKFDRARDEFAQAVDKISEARSALDNLSGNHIEIIEHRLQEITDFDASVTDLTFDLDDLERAVKREISEEEARREAERQRQLEEARRAREAAEERRKEEQKKLNDLLNSTRRVRTGTGGGDVFNTSGSSRSSSAPAGGSIFGANNTRR